MMKFITGVFTGALIGVGFMCLFQMNGMNTEDEVNWFEEDD